MGNTIYYDVKSYQVKITIVNHKCVQLKLLKILTADRRKYPYSYHDCDSNNKTPFDAQI